jgi:uncharacterized protein YidB (DUF937 family)
MALVGLGILAYQNRDKLAGLLRGQSRDADGSAGSGQQQAEASQGGLIDRALDALGSGGGLGDLLDSFRRSGNAEAADSWVRTGANQPLDPEAVQRAIDPETLAELSAQTGLSEPELLKRLAMDIPQAVDRLTPNGELPNGPRKGLLDDVPTAGSA